MGKHRQNIEVVEGVKIAFDQAGRATIIIPNSMNGELYNAWNTKNRNALRELIKKYRKKLQDKK